MPHVTISKKSAFIYQLNYKVLDLCIYEKMHENKICRIKKIIQFNRSPIRKTDIMNFKCAIF